MNDDQVLSVDPAATGEVWRIDVDASLQSVMDSPACPSLLYGTLTGALSWQTRNETPVRRALRSPRVAPQWVAALLALGATVNLERGDDGPTEVTLESLLQRRTEGKISALHVPLGGVERRWGQATVARTPADEPIVAAIAAVVVRGDVVRQARVALTGVWPGSVRLAEAAARLVGGPLDAERIQAVAAAVEEEVAPTGDFLGSAEYRRAMAGVLTRRALESCAHQEAGDE
jgi:CO/xanthine dehydrogenase FAD-binding subunit